MRLRFWKSQETSALQDLFDRASQGTTVEDLYPDDIRRSGQTTFRGFDQERLYSYKLALNRLTSKWAKALKAERDRPEDVKPAALYENMSGILARMETLAENITTPSLKSFVNQGNKAIKLTLAAQFFSLFNENVSAGFNSDFIELLSDPDYDLKSEADKKQFIECVLKDPALNDSVPDPVKTYEELCTAVFLGSVQSRVEARLNNLTR